MKQPNDFLRGRAKKPVSKACYIVLDSDVADEVEELEGALDKAREQLRTEPTNVTLRERVRDLELDLEVAQERLRGVTAKFVFKSLGRGGHEELADAHPPTPDQVRDAKKDGIRSLAWNPDTFPPALVAACGYAVVGEDEDGNEVLEPLTEEWVNEIWKSDEWNEAELMALFTTAEAVNSNRRVAHMGNASRRTRS